MSQPAAVIAECDHTDQLVQIGDQIWLAIAVDKIHLFDPKTGITIRSDS